MLQWSNKELDVILGGICKERIENFSFETTSKLTNSGLRRE